MKYLSIDTETTGLDSENHQILEIGIIAEDAKNPLSYEETPKFQAIVQYDEDIVGSPYALTMPRNQEILKILANIPRNESEKIEYFEKHNIVHIDYLAAKMYYWYRNNVKGAITSLDESPIKTNVAGKNFRQFDYEFIKRIPNFFDYFSFNRRYLDLGCFCVNIVDDDVVPNQEECLKRLGINEVVTHEAINDAWQVVLGLREFY